MRTAGRAIDRPRWIAVLISTALSAFALAIPAPPAAAAQGDEEPAEIHPQVLAEIDEQAEADEPLQALLVLDATADLSDVPEDPVAVTDALRAVAEETQAVVLADLMELSAEPGEVTVVNRFWLTNMLLVEVPAEHDAVEALADVPGVDRVLPNFEVTAIEPVSSDVTTTVVDDRTWGIDKIQAHRVWRELGVTGAGVRVATLDTGVDITHPELAGSMVTDDPADPTYPGGWMEFDAEGKLVSSTPHDSQFHGTHVSGTIHGKGATGVAIGVAPGAEMMHGLVLQGGTGSYAQVVAGMQWVMSPTDADGNPAGRPADVLNMSLGSPGFHQELVAPTRAIRAAGIFPSISIGNNCRPPLTTGSPGNVYEAIAIGATDAADDVWSGSCGGAISKDDWPDPPSTWPDSYVKPDLTAPGVGVISATPGGFYGNLTGTSMAAPHVSGTVALMMSAAPGLTVTEAYDLLVDTSFFDGRYGEERPNPRLGNGRINAYAATVAATDLVSGITGTIKDAATDQPIAGATVTVDGSGSVRSAADGTYHVRLSPGTYRLRIAAFGYETTTIDTVDVAKGPATVIDITMQPLPAGSIAGTVSLARSGLGVPNATVRVDGTPVAVNTDAAGHYTVDLPVGTWTVRAEAHGFPPADPVAVTVREGQAATADLALGDPLLRAGVLGDDGSQITQFLNDHGVVAEHVDWSEDPARYPVVVVNNPADPGRAAVEQFLADTDASGTGVVFLDSWATPPLLTGVNVLSTYEGNPASRGQAWSTSYRELYYEVTAEHPIVDGYAVGDRIVHDGQLVSWKVHAWFDGYTGEGTQVIANAGNDRDGILGGGIAVAERPNNRHVLLSMHAATPSGGPLDWSDETGRLLLNALEWSAPDVGEQAPVFVEHNLRVDSAVVPRDEPVTAAVDVSNVGTGAGVYDAVLRVDGRIEARTPVTLAPGETTTVSWTIERDELGTYEVGVDELRTSFRVRGPLVDLTVRTLEGPDTSATPMAGAAVDLLYDGTLRPLGATGEDGRLRFEAPLADGDYTLVVRRTATAGDVSYLLHRPEHIAGDTAVTIAPRVGATGSGSEWDRAAIVDLDLTRVNGSHQAWTYLRSSITAPYGFAVRPGRLVATVGEYDARHVHAMFGLERDWWYASEQIAGLHWPESTSYRHVFGGPASAVLTAARDDGTRFTADWAATDAAGIPFEVAASTQLRMLDDMPPWAVLDELPALVQGRADDEADVILSLTDPDGERVYDGVVSWSERSVTRELSDLVGEVSPGSYDLGLAIDLGPYAPGTISASATLPGAPLRWLAHDSVTAGNVVEVTIAFTASGTGTAEVRELIGRSGTVVAQPIGLDWQVTDWSASGKATYDGHGTWTFRKVRTDEDVTLSYTLAPPTDIETPSEWTLAGTLTQPGGSSHEIMGDRELAVVEPDVVHGKISGTVSDSATGAPIAGATVTAEPGGVSTVTTADGAYTLTLPLGTYELTVSAFGYADASVADVAVVEGEGRMVDLAMESHPRGTISGTVAFVDSGQGLPGALIEVSGTPLTAVTGADGRYEIAGVPEGSYGVTVDAEGFVPPTAAQVTVTAGGSARADFVLAAQLDVALVTSRPDDFEVLFSSHPDLKVTAYSARELAAAAKHELVIYGYEEYIPSTAEFQAFIDATDANGTGVIFLDQWFLGWGNGIRMLSQHTGQPASVGSRLASGSRPSYYVVAQPHPILAGYSVGDRIPVDVVNGSPWISWFDGYAGDGRQVLAEMGVTDSTGIYGHGIGIDERPTNRHVLLASLSNNVLRTPHEDWSDEAEAIFWNAVQWAAPQRAPDASRFVEWNLRAEPHTVLAGEPITVSVDVTNVGGSSGSQTVELLVDGAVEATANVALGAGETRTVSWTVVRDGLTRYETRVAHLTGDFVVRPPNVELSVQTLRRMGRTPEPMAGATVSLVQGSQLIPVGVTDDLGRLTFAAPVAVGDYTIVVRRAATEEHEFAYLLQRPVHIEADLAVTMTPWSLPGGRDGWDGRTPWERWCDRPGAEQWCGDPLDRSAVLDLDLAGIEGQQAVTYLRGALTGPYGFAFGPGQVVATTGPYDLRHVHSLTGPAREWQAVGDEQSVALTTPTHHRLAFGGPAQALLDVLPGDGTAFTVDWSIADASGNTFELVAAAQMRPFAPLPDAVVLEEVPEMVAGQLPDEAEVVLRLWDPHGTAVHAEGLAWSERPVGFDLAKLVDEVTPGSYAVTIEADLGPYPPGRVVSAPVELTIRTPEPSAPEPEVEPDDDADAGAEAAPLSDTPSEPPGPWTWRAGPIA